MQYHPKIKNRIRGLRKKGNTFQEIRQNLKMQIPQSSLSYICRGLRLTLAYHKKIQKLNKQNRDKARHLAVQRNRENRARYMENLKARNLGLLNSVNKDALKIALAMLYLGEGSKWPSHRGLMLGSSEPRIIRLYLELLKLCYDIDTSNLRCRIQVRADQNIEELESFWSETTALPRKNFYRTYIDTRTVGKPTKKKNYLGVCTIAGGGTEIQLELDIIIDLLAKHVGL